MYTFSPATKAESAKINQNFTDLSTGVGDVDNNRLQKASQEIFFDHIASGGVWSITSGLTCAMTAAVGYISDSSYRYRVAIAAVVSKVFTASKDTYVDVGYDGTIYYTEVANNAASPALSANRIRIAIVISGGASITAINQGEESKVLPIASSIPYAVTDSLGNLICNRSPNSTILGYRQVVASQGGITTTRTDITGANATVKVPANRKIEIEASFNVQSTVAADVAECDIMESSTIIKQWYTVLRNANNQENTFNKVTISPTAGTHTYKLAVIRAAGSGTITNAASATAICFIQIKVL